MSNVYVFAPSTLIFNEILFPVLVGTSNSDRAPPLKTDSDVHFHDIPNIGFNVKHIKGQMYKGGFSYTQGHKLVYYICSHYHFPCRVFFFTS